MKIAIIDCFSGISGDMTLGALINQGVPLDYIKEEISKLGISNFEIKENKVKRHSISASKVDIEYDEPQQPERNFHSIKKIIEESRLAPNIKNKAISAFKILGEAEAHVHGTTLDKIHFHEVGAIDSIIDLVGSIIGFEYLKVAKIFTLPVPLGTGFTSTAHGNMPVPPPASLEILKEYPIIHKDSEFEMTTPTGATLLKVLSDEILPTFLHYFPEKVGYGAGSKETEKWPNLLRLITARIEEQPGVENLQVIETNIDDMNPEIYPYLMEKMFDTGARDVFMSNILMKKGRAGIKLSILADLNIVPQIEEIIFSETTSIGLRKYAVNRTILPRKEELVTLDFGEIAVKVIEYKGKKIFRPEYEECKKIARKHKKPITDVYRQIDNLNNTNE